MAVAVVVVVVVLGGRGRAWRVWQMGSRGLSPDITILGNAYNFIPIRCEYTLEGLNCRYAVYG